MNKIAHSSILFLTALLMLCGCNSNSQATSELAMEGLDATDENNNGTWDDIDRYVDARDLTERQRQALLFYAQVYQKILLNPEVGTELKEKSLVPVDQKEPDFTSQALACLWLEFGDEASSIHRDFQDYIISNFRRYLAYAKFNGNSGGGMYRSWNEEKNGNPCPF